EELAKLLNIKHPHVVEKMLAELSEEYKKRDSGVEICCLDGTYQMRVKPEYLSKVRHLAATAEINKSIQRTLALIAVKEPIKQSLVVRYRNNKAYEHIKFLLEKQYIERERQGRTYVLRTTEKFKQCFGEIKIAENNKAQETNQETNQNTKQSI
ncbi:MAG: SMC-Scp complex subunit ScpB, partial [Candidatus Diapherotrites archaeon]